MNLELTGRLLKKYDVVNVSEKFKKREFVVELSEEINGSSYINYAAMQLVNNKCDIIDKYNEGDMVKVSFNIRGSKWTKDGKERYFSNLDAWRVEAAGAAGSQPAPQNNNQYQNNGGNQPASSNNFASQGSYNSNSSEQSDDLPF
jgi:single-stranded DNA-binding protein